ncbi:MAG: acyl-CoA dehydrogenase family protein [Acidimicrobiia bacterium]
MNQRPMPSPCAERVAATVDRSGSLTVAPLLDAIAAQAEKADLSRSVDPDVITALKASPVLPMVASTEIGGSEASVARLGAELAAVAAACGSTAWCLWNHWSVFHLFVGALGPDHADLLRAMVEGHQWVCFPGGAGSRVFGRIDGDEVVLNGSAMFGSGSRYADWTGVAFAIGDGSRPPTPDELRFAVVPLDGPGVRIEPTWDGASVRASATDTIHYDGVRIPLARCTPWFAANRAAAFRDPALPMVNGRYREDWVGLSDIWLAHMGVGTVQAALEEAIASIDGRRAIMGANMVNMPNVQANLGAVTAAVTTARFAVEGAAADVDARIAAGRIPTEADFQRQGAVSATALTLCQDAMMTLLRTLGGNGLREGGTFERRWRDVAAMPIHINTHPDRVHLRLGQFLLGVEGQRF